jgi:sigma-B regulation protein RsbU (phosphoserine phosphatase)
MPAAWKHRSFDHERLEVASFERPFYEVGGDLLEIRPLGNGRWDILILDVAGKGCVANRIAGQLQRAFHGFGPGRPGEIMAHLNQIMARVGEDLACFATAMLLHLDLPAGRARVVDAGHPPLLRRRFDGVVEQIKLQLLRSGTPTDLPLGLKKETLYLERTIRVSQGDTFVLFTDGLSEARNSQGQALGYLPLLDILCQRENASPEELLRELVGEAQGRAGGELLDDATCVVLRIPDPPCGGVFSIALAA